MVIDTSALVAILLNEPERRAFNELIEDADSLVLSAASLIETSIVLEARHGAEAVRSLDLLLAKAGVVIEPVDTDQASVARQAFRQFGRGRHPAGLNFGDCFSYALAQVRGEALLFKGNDFSRTDIRVASAEV